MNKSTDIRRMDWLLNEDNLIVLQLIGAWEDEYNGEPMPESELVKVLRNEKFYWNVHRINQSIVQLSVLKVLHIKSENGRAGYQINHEIFYLLLEIAAEQLNSKSKAVTIN